MSNPRTEHQFIALDGTGVALEQNEEYVVVWTQLRYTKNRLLFTHTVRLLNAEDVHPVIIDDGPATVPTVELTRTDR